MRKSHLKFHFFNTKMHKIDFKTFCEGGSHEYVSAKKRLKELHLKHQNEFQSSETTIGLTDTDKHNKIIAYSLYINPLAFFDVHFIIASGCVVLVAILEKKLADLGIIGPAAALSGLLRLSLPIVGLGSVLYLISHLGSFI